MCLHAYVWMHVCMYRNFTVEVMIFSRANAAGEVSDPDFIGMLLTQTIFEADISVEIIE